MTNQQKKYKILSTSQSIFLGALIIILIVSVVHNYLEVITFSKSITLNQFLAFCIYAISAFLATDITKRLMAKKYPETGGTLKILSKIFLALLIFIYIVLVSKDGDKYQTSLTVLISSIFLGTGWWIQATINSAASRKSHTINTVMNQRHSKTFFEKLDNAYKFFGIDKIINEEIASQYVHESKRVGPTIHPEIMNACRDATYVLNFYEFIAAGVNNGDFDEKLIKECFMVPMTSFEKRAFHIIACTQKQAGKEVYSNMIALIDKWSTEKSFTTRKKNNESIELDNTSHKLEELYIPSVSTVTAIDNKTAEGSVS
ncbi:DUF4760 domain-containing protein [Pectobacterium versatile]|uniref:DUF4760 domain-containing protein n=1 Tax=Pectobacterium versatile TaxID=2488639 RepID=UPI001F1FB1CE|nr:DUF4760 domain-containing protein [Pectobacterium versatile]